MLEEEKAIVSAFENPNFKWRTVPGVARELSVTEQTVFHVIDTNKRLFVQSSIPSKQGVPIYTTRRHFRRTSKPIDRVIGAFKNRAI